MIRVATIGCAMGAILSVATLPVVPTRAQSTPVEAQAQAPSSNDDIVVTAREAANEAQVRALARAITPRLPFDEPLARFTYPLCFATGGLPRSMLIDVANRLVSNAQQAKLRLAGERCKANVVVMFVDDGKAEAASIAKRHSGIFGDAQPSEIRRILDEPGPVHVWTAAEIRSRDGDRLMPNLNGPPTLKVPIASHIVLPVRRDMLYSVILIDRKAVIGRSLDQVADYATMRTLAAVRPKGATGGDTILTLFDPEPARPPAGMTDFDRSYLSALYAGAGNQRAGTKIGQIARSIIKQTAAPPAKPQKRD
jgi:hypothetical protein